MGKIPLLSPTIGPLAVETQLLETQLRDLQLRYFVDGNILVIIGVKIYLLSLLSQLKQKDMCNNDTFILKSGLVAFDCM